MGTYGLGQGLAQGIQLRSMIEDLHWRRQQRKLQSEAMIQALEDRKRKAAFEDFSLHQTLSSMGAIPEAVGNELKTKLEGEFGSNWTSEKPVTQTPIGGYFMPTASETHQREEEAAGRKAGTAQKEKYAESYGAESGKLAAESEDLDKTGLSVTYPAYGDQPEFTTKVPRRGRPGQPGYAEVIKDIRAIKAGKIINHRYETDHQTGKTYLLGEDADTGEPIRKEMPGQITPQPARSEREEKELLPSDSQVQGWIEKHKKKAYEEGLNERERGILEGTIKYDPNDPNQAPSDIEHERRAAQAKRREIDKELRARGTEEIKSEIRKKYVQGQRGKGAKTAAATNGSTGETDYGSVKAVPASKLNEFLTHPDVKKRGIKDVNALRKDLAKHGYSIDEAQ
jgi:hypothetical protein